MWTGHDGKLEKSISCGLAFISKMLDVSLKGEKLKSQNLIDWGSISPIVSINSLV